MNHFNGALQLEALCCTDGKPLFNRSGKRLFLRLCDQTYHSDEFGEVLIEKGQITDLGSVPRIPLVWYDLGALPGAEEAYGLHDWLYGKKLRTREEADTILREALELAGVNWRRRNTIYQAVRLFGCSYWES